MKYRLKKDLPFAKAGTRVWGYLENPFLRKGMQVFVKSTDCKQGNHPDDRGLIYIGIYDELIVGGWIEEVKPREWYVALYGLGEFIVGYKNKFESDKELIKVQEVLWITK